MAEMSTGKYGSAQCSPPCFQPIKDNSIHFKGFRAQTRYWGPLIVHIKHGANGGLGRLMGGAIRSISINPDAVGILTLPVLDAGDGVTSENIRVRPVGAIDHQYM